MVVSLSIRVREQQGEHQNDAREPTLHGVVDFVGSLHDFGG